MPSSGLIKQMDLLCKLDIKYQINTMNNSPATIHTDTNDTTNTEEALINQHLADVQLIRRNTVQEYQEGIWKRQASNFFKYWKKKYGKKVKDWVAIVFIWMDNCTYCKQTEVELNGIINEVSLSLVKLDLDKKKLKKIQATVIQTPWIAWLLVNSILLENFNNGSYPLITAVSPKWEVKTIFSDFNPEIMLYDFIFNLLLDSSFKWYEDSQLFHTIHEMLLEKKKLNITSQIKNHWIHYKKS